jgi:hypothetical protein
MPRPSSGSRHRATPGDVKASLLRAHDDALMLDLVSDARRLAALARCNGADVARHARSQAASIERYGQRALSLAESVRAIATHAVGGE